MKRAILSVVILLAVADFASAQQYLVLWNFGTSAGDGVWPVAGLIFDRTGNIYGTTTSGGAYGQGSVFELTPNSDGSWSESVLYSFCPGYPQLCTDGLGPKAGLIIDSLGNLYGTTYYGGSSVSCGNTLGCGTLFELSPPGSPGETWTETVLFNFCSNFSNNQCLDGEFPMSQLIAGGAGTIYGTTSGGGRGHSSGGTAFRLSLKNSNWQETVLYNFCSLGQGDNCPDGTMPEAGVTADKLGNLYGTTARGGGLHGGGTVYKLSPRAGGWSETVLATAGPNGQNGVGPTGTVSLDGIGNLYGTAAGGGQTNNGTVFRLGVKGGATVVSLGQENGGSTPESGVLIDNKRNALFGTTQAGGSGQGNVYQIVPPAQMTSLYSFCSQPNCSDGMSPQANLVEDQSGNLYGTTKYGGTGTNCLNGTNVACGVVFEIVQTLKAQKSSSKRSQVRRTILPTQPK
jgi:uncharacterized repeat protein (TIGR03803 family)